MALVIVLGLIALLIISSVTFAILMRVERAGAANARNTIMARQVVKGALSYAIAAIDDAATNLYPVMYNFAFKNESKPDPKMENEEKTDPINSQTIWHGMKEDNWDSHFWTAYTDPLRPSPTRDDTDTIRDIRFWKDTLGSIDHTIGGQFASFKADSRIMVQSAENYLPYGIRHRAYAQYSGNSDSGEKVSSEWIPVATRMPKDDTDLGDVIGRYAFIAFDTTGAPDLTAIATKGDVERGMGADPAEIQLVSGFFDGTTSSSFKKKLQGKVKRFDNVAEILAATRSDEDDTKGCFAEGSSYSAFSYCPPDLAPRKSDFKNDLMSKTMAITGKNIPKPFLGKINIGGDGSDEHIEHLRNHKARIMKAFYDSGLTESSASYPKKDIHEKACRDPSCPHFDCGTADYTLPAKYNSEQAFWAYLGLIDYIDGDNEPAWDPDIDLDEETQKFARPATEDFPLFNGFISTVRFLCMETYDECKIPIKDADGNVVDEKTAKVFCTTNAEYAVEFDGKIVFANRQIDKDDNNGKGFFDNLIEGRIGFAFEGNGSSSELWCSKFAKSFSKGRRSGDKYVIEQTGDDGVFMKSDARMFDTGNPLPELADSGCATFSLMATNRLKTAKTLAVPKDETSKASNRENLLIPPDTVMVGAAGATYAPNGTTMLRQTPALNYGTFDLGNVWLTSLYDTSKDNNDGRAGKELWETWSKLPDRDEVYLTKDDAVADLTGSGSGVTKYKLKAWAYDVVLWGEMLDPAYCHAEAAEYLYRGQVYPRVAFVSHGEDAECDEQSFENYSVAVGFRDNLSFADADGLIDAMTQADKTSNDPFSDLVADLRTGEDYAGDYFVIGPYEGYSLLQEFLLSEPSALMPGDRNSREKEEENKQYTTFHGHVDGSRLVNAHAYTSLDPFDEQWHSRYSRDDAMETVGELGYLPVGPWATIRLSGAQCETNVNLKVNPNVSRFNGLPEQTYTAFTKDKTHGKLKAVHAKMQRPFHTVLDHFTLQGGPAFGRINLNTPDLNVMASVFNKLPVKTETGVPSMNDKSRLSEPEALELAELFHKTWLKDVGKCWLDEEKKRRQPPDVQTGERAPFTRLSELGWMFDGHDFGEYCSKCGGTTHSHKLKLASNREREAVICNSCGLFTTRGQTYTILLRGEAYSPLFGKTTVMDGDGTTLASRRAIAQIWRDTYEDDEGNHPVFVQFFKIFDE